MYIKHKQPPPLNSFKYYCILSKIIYQQEQKEIQVLNNKVCDQNVYYVSYYVQLLCINVPLGSHSSWKSDSLINNRFKRAIFEVSPNWGMIQSFKLEISLYSHNIAIFWRYSSPIFGNFTTFGLLTLMRLNIGQFQQRV